MKRVFITILMLLLISFSCFGLLPGSSPVKKVFPRWTSYTNSSYITDLVLDKNILWAAGGGVTKFDLTAGTRIKYLKEHGLASNNVQKMVLLDKILWITTANGITCFNIKKNTRKSFYKSDGLPDDAVTAVAVDKTGNRIWFGTWEGHLFNINSAKKKWGLLKAGIKIPDAIITSLVVNPVNGSILVGTWDSGLYSYMPGRPGSPVPLKHETCTVDQNGSPLPGDKKNKQKLLRGVQGGGFLEKSPPGRRRQEKALLCISSMLFDNQRLWVGTIDRGLWLSELKKGPMVFKKIKKLSDYRVTSIKASPRGDKILVTTMGNGLFIYTGRTGKWKILDKKRGIPTDDLNISVCDEENIFSGSEGEGVIRFNLITGQVNQYKLLNEIAHNNVSVVTPEPQNNRLWIGTEGNGAAFLDLDPGKWTILNTSNRILNSDVVNCITVDGSKGRAWIGTDDGMVKYDIGSRKHQRYGFEEGLDSVLVYASGFDHIKRLWAAFYIGSPALFNPQKNRWVTLEEAPSSICYAFSIARKSKSIWMATTNGIVNYNIKTHKNKNYWPDIEFRSVLFDPGKGELWAGSWGKGLFYMEVKKFQQQKIKKFENLAVLDIKRDERNNTIWFATNIGVFCLDKERQTFEHLDVTAGLGFNYVLSIGITADSIWFGTWGGGVSRLKY